MRIALDAMGGDHAPGPIVAGAVQAVAQIPNLRSSSSATRRRSSRLGAAGGAVGERIELFHCTQAVTMEESPVEALRKKPDNSISRCWQLLAERKVDAIVSAGNTGAMVAGGLRLRRFLKNVRRPGIATIMPTLKGAVRPHRRRRQRQSQAVTPVPVRRHGQHLRQAHPAPRAADHRPDERRRGRSQGHDLAKDTHALFNGSPFREQFVGNIEGRDIHRGACDVVVTDGFVGNVVLKVCEGVFEFVMKMVGKELAQGARQDAQEPSDARLAIAGP